MNNMIRSTWLRFVLLFALVLSASNCGDASEIIIQELECPALEGFAGGVYSFTVDVGGIADGCAGGAFNAFDRPGPLRAGHLAGLIDPASRNHDYAARGGCGIGNLVLERRSHAT